MSSSKPWLHLSIAGILLELLRFLSATMTGSEFGNLNKKRSEYENATSESTAEVNISWHYMSSSKPWLNLSIAGILLELLRFLSAT
jgi:hypothetical protein